MRQISKHILNAIKSRKITILYGPRQVGKTTLMKNLAKKFENALFLNAEIPSIKNLLETKNPEKIYSYFGKSKYIFIDEAQTIHEIGLVLKILYDTFSDIHIMVTGSSSFELSSKIHEPLTGRNRTFFLPPLSLEEWKCLFLSGVCQREKDE